MKFNFKERAQALLAKMAPKLAGLAGEGLYGLVCASILYPVAQAMQQSDLAGQQAIAATLAAMGISVLSNRIQRWQDVNEAAAEIAALEPGAEEQTALANAIAEADVQGAVAGQLDPVAAERVKKNLRKEMKRLGNWEQYSLRVKRGVGIIGDGNTVADRNSVVVNSGGKTGDIYTGRAKKTVVVKTPDKSKPALERYLHWLQGKCDDLPLAAMGGHKGQGEEMTLTDVYQALDTERDLQTERARSSSPTKPGEPIVWRKGIGEKKLSALDAARMYRRLVLLGGPGSGKSAFVNTLAIRVASAAAPRKKNATKAKDGSAQSLAADFGLPLRLLVREMGPELAKLDLPAEADEDALDQLVALVRQCWKAELKRAGAVDAWPLIDKALREGEATMIFDGLDEVPLAIRQRARRAISAAISAYKKSRCIVTCRTRSYTSAVSLDGFKSIGLALFDKDKVKAFVGAFYHAPVNRHSLSEDQIKERIDELEGAALGRLVKLSPTPLLLMVMAIVHRSSVSLPTEKVKLFDLAIEVLFSRWQMHTHELVISPTVKRFLVDETLQRKVLERIAYDTHAVQSKLHDVEAALSRYEILPWLETTDYLGPGAAEFLDYIDQTSGLLIGHGGGDGGSGPPATYGFPHRQFQEHLAGRYMIQGSPMRRRKTYLERADEGDFWSEPAQLGAETLRYSATEDDRLSDLIMRLAPELAPQTTAEWRATLWAGRMAALAGKNTVLRDAEEAGQPGFWDQRLMPRLLALLNNDKLPGIERAEAGNVLAELGDPRFDPDFYHLPFDLKCRLRGFVPIEAGPFVMGEEGDKDAPPHTVDVPRFFMSRWPVTWAQYRMFVKDTQHSTSGMWTEPDVYDGPDNHPVWGVNWHDAMAYCDWLDARLRGDPRTPPALLEVVHAGGSVTLPSEAEWEKAARGGSPRPFTLGVQNDPNRANYDKSGLHSPSAVGCYPGVEDRYSYGCDDLLGNVWEWTRSWYRPYPYLADDREEKRAQIDDERCVVRGGSYENQARSARCAFRRRGPPDFGNYSCGFRVVVSPFSASGP